MPTCVWRWSGLTDVHRGGACRRFLKRVVRVKLCVIKKFCLQILEGLHYLHTHDPVIIHRDLKCENILVNGSSGELLISDFGLSTQVSARKAHSVLGTPHFMAPELYDEVYDQKVDIYSFGMCLLEMITGRIPYHECTNAAQIYKKVTHGVLPTSLQCITIPEIVDFIRWCISHDPNDRPTAAELLKSEFLTSTEHDDEDELYHNCESEDETESHPLDGLAELMASNGLLTVSTATAQTSASHHSGASGAVHAGSVVSVLSGGGGGLTPTAGTVDSLVAPACAAPSSATSAGLSDATWSVASAAGSRGRAGSEASAGSVDAPPDAAEGVLAQNPSSGVAPAPAQAQAPAPAPAPVASAVGASSVASSPPTDAQPVTVATMRGPSSTAGSAGELATVQEQPALEAEATGQDAPSGHGLSPHSRTSKATVSPSSAPRRGASSPTSLGARSAATGMGRRTSEESLEVPSEGPPSVGTASVGSRGDMAPVGFAPTPATTTTSKALVAPTADGAARGPVDSVMMFTITRVGQGVCCAGAAQRWCVGGGTRRCLDCRMLTPLLQANCTK